MRCTRSLPAWRGASGIALLTLVLSGSAPVAASEPSTADPLLERTGRMVVSFMAQLSNVKCTELVTQARMDKRGKMQYAEESTFDYLLLAQSTNGELTLAESRQAEKESHHKQNLPLLVTNGFSTLLLVFHPSYQAGFEFTPLEDDVLNGRSYARLHFRHIRGLRSTAVLLLRSREYPLDLEGTAWVERQSGVIVKIVAGLESSLADVGLKSLQSEVVYAPVAFAGSRQTHWLPASAVVEVETPRQHWRNVHCFTAYKLFSTSVKSTIGDAP